MPTTIKSKESGKLKKLKAKTGEVFEASFLKFLASHGEIKYDLKAGMRTTLSHMYNYSQKLPANDPYRADLENLLRKYRLHFHSLGEGNGNELVCESDDSDDEPEKPKTPEPEKPKTPEPEKPKTPEQKPHHVDPQPETDAIDADAWALLNVHDAKLKEAHLTIIQLQQEKEKEEKAKNSYKQLANKAMERAKSLVGYFGSKSKKPVTETTPTRKENPDSDLEDEDDDAHKQFEKQLVEDELELKKKTPPQATQHPFDPRFEGDEDEETKKEARAKVEALKAPPPTATKAPTSTTKGKAPAPPAPTKTTHIDPTSATPPAPTTPAITVAPPVKKEPEGADLKDFKMLKDKKLFDPDTKANTKWGNLIQHVKLTTKLEKPSYRRNPTSLSNSKYV